MHNHDCKLLYNVNFDIFLIDISAVTSPNLWLKSKLVSSDEPDFKNNISKLGVHNSFKRFDNPNKIITW